MRPTRTPRPGGRRRRLVSHGAMPRGPAMTFNSGIGDSATLLIVSATKVSGLARMVRMAGGRPDHASHADYGYLFRGSMGMVVGWLARPSVLMYKDGRANQTNLPFR